ncbi:MAG: hypothetical protein ABSC08_07850 [Bryobacteraceae bacterium]
MPRSFAVFTCAAFTLSCYAQDRSGLAEILNFEAPHSGSQPSGWSAYPAGSVFMDD